MNVYARVVGTSAIVAMILISGNLSAANRIRIVNQTLPVNSESNIVPVLADLDQDVLGFSVSFDFDSDKIAVREVELGEDVEPLDPDFNNGRIDNDAGTFVYGVVFALDEEDLATRLAEGTGRELLRLVVDVLETEETTTVVNLRNVSGHPGRRNVFTGEDGLSVSPGPSLVDGTLTFASDAPEITDLQDNRGLQGDRFLVIGQNFDLPGLVVRVCGVEAEFELLGDNQTLDVTAPDCESLDWAELEVCNEFGCESRAQGFFYEEPPELTPDITDIQSNRGRAGARMIVIGQKFNEPGLRVEVCGVDAEFELLGDDQTLFVVVPPCAEEGWARVEVCTVHGCDGRNEGFFYEEADEGTPFIRGDANDDGTVDLSDGVAILNELFLGLPAPAVCDDTFDANDSGFIDLSDGVYVLNFLFQGGARPPPPYPDPGLDETDDDLPDC